MNKKLGKISIYLVLIVFSILMLFPFYWMIISSLKSNLEISQKPPTFFPNDITFDNYAKVLEVVNWERYFLNSIIVAGLCVLVTLYTTITGAYFLSKSQLPGKHFILGILIGLMMVPYELLIVTNYTTIVKMNLNDSLLALVLPFMSSIFYTLLLKNYFDSISPSLYNAVMVDGGGEWRYLWRILVPASKPMLISISLFTLISSWNSFMWPLLIIKSEANRTVTFGVYAFISEGGEHFELMMALSVLSILPMVLVFAFMRKYLIRGVKFSGTKG